MSHWNFTYVLDTTPISFLLLFLFEQFNKVLTNQKCLPSFFLRLKVLQVRPGSHNWESCLVLWILMITKNHKKIIFISELYKITTYVLKIQYIFTRIPTHKEFTYSYIGRGSFYYHCHWMFWKQKKGGQCYWGLHWSKEKREP